MNKNIMLFGIILFLAGCSNNSSQYYWGNYSSDLNDYYSDPKYQSFYLKTLADITETEHSGKKIPPGILAEYGYMEASLGNTTKAVDLFEREKQAWPESSAFMDKAIANAKAGSKPGSAAPAAHSPGV